MVANFYKNWIKPLAKDVSTVVLDTLFPIHCIPCGKEGRFICNVCQINLKRVDHQVCIMCRKPSPFGMTHGECQNKYSPEGLISIFDYHDPAVAEIIIQAKYSFLPGAFKELGEMAAREIDSRHTHLLASASGEPFALAPLPLHPTRKRWRGFNQAEILCQSISEALGFATTSVLVRCKATKTQKDLKRDERLKNVDGVFAVDPEYNRRVSLRSSSPFGGGCHEVTGEGAVSEHLRTKNIILVDDVTTTGATLLEAVKTLKQNGAGKVWCLTVARD